MDKYILQIIIGLGFTGKSRRSSGYKHNGNHFAKIGILITQNGMWNNKEVVSSNWINKSLSDFTVLSNDIAKMNAPLPIPILSAVQSLSLYFARRAT